MTTLPPDKSLLPPTEQMELIPSSDMPDGIFFESESQGEFTGERLAVRDPERYKAILSLLAESLGVKYIGRILHVSPNTVMAVREREPDAVDTLKKKIAGGAREISRLCVEGLREDLLDPNTKVSAKDKGIIMGIMTEKAELLSGGATSRVNITDGQSGHQALTEYMDQLRAAYKTGLGVEKGIKRAEGVEVLEPVPERADGAIGHEDQGNLTTGSDEDKDADKEVASDK